MGSLSFTASIELEILRSETLTNELTDNSMDLRLLQKYASNDIEKIHAKYAPEKDRIRSEIKGLDKQEMRDEYEDLMGELSDIKDKEDEEVARVEEQLHDQEEEINLDSDTKQAQLEASRTNLENLKEGRQERIEQEYGYFQ